MSHSTPKVFISATSADLGKVRQLVKEALLTNGCHPVEQTNFPPDARRVGDMLRERIGECQALIHIVGLRYGSEPDAAQLSSGAPRRSYTQMEYHVGRELQDQRGDQRFRVYTFVCPEDFPFDPADPEPEEKRLLQQAHRATLLEQEHLYERATTPELLKERILALQEEVHTIRREIDRAHRRFLLALAAVFLALCGLGWGLWHFGNQTGEVKKDTAGIKQDTADLKQTQEALKQQQAEMLRQLNADPEALKINLQKGIEARAAAQLEAARKVGADWRKIDEITKARETALRKVDDIIATIKSGLVGAPDSIFLEATKLLRGPGGEAETLAYLQAQEERIWASAEGPAALAQEAAKKLRDTLRPLLLRADLLESQLAYDQAIAIRERVVQKAPDWWEARNGLGILLCTLARYGEAEKHLRVAEGLASSDQERATALNNLASLVQDTNRLAEAEPLLRRAVKLDETTYGPNHPITAVHLNNLAQWLRITNRLAEAEPIMRRVLHIFEASFGETHDSVATALDNLALLLLATNRAGEAEPLLRRALKIDESLFGPHHPQVATVLNNLAGLLETVHRLAEAEPLARRAVKIDEASFGPNHPSVARDLQNLAQLLKGASRLAEAEPLLRRAVKIDETCFGLDHPNVAIGLNNLANLLQDTGRLVEAETLFKRALKIQEDSLGPNHPYVAGALNNLAQLLKATNRLAESESLLRRAVKIEEVCYDSNHPKVASTLNNLAILLKETGRRAEAEPLMQRVVKILETAYERTTLASPTALGNLADLLQGNHRLAEAELLMRRALKISETSDGPNHPAVAIRLNNLALLLQATKRLTEAEPLSQRSVSILLHFQRANQHEHPGFRDILLNYLLLLQAQGLAPDAIAAKLREVGVDDVLGAGAALKFTEDILHPQPAGPADVAIAEVIAGGQGEALGLKVGDVLVRYQGEAGPITSVNQFINLVSKAQGDAIPLEIRRGSEMLKLTAKAGKFGAVIENRPRAAAAKPEAPKTADPTPPTTPTPK